MRSAVPLGRVLLEAVVDLGDLDVVVVAEHPGHVGQHAKRHVDADAHVGREQDGRPSGRGAAISCALRRRNPVVPITARPPRRATDRRWLEARRGHRELDEDALPAEHALGIVGDGHPEPPTARHLAGVAPDGRVPGRLERGHQAQILPSCEERDEATAHAAGGAGDHDVSHCAESSAQRFTRPYGSRTA